MTQPTPYLFPQTPAHPHHRDHSPGPREVPLEGVWDSQVECLGTVACKQLCPGPPCLGTAPGERAAGGYTSGPWRRLCPATLGAANRPGDAQAAQSTGSDQPSALAGNSAWTWGGSAAGMV